MSGSGSSSAPDLAADAVTFWHADREEEDSTGNVPILATRNCCFEVLECYRWHVMLKDIISPAPPRQIHWGWDVPKLGLLERASLSCKQAGHACHGILQAWQYAPLVADSHEVNGWK